MITKLPLETERLFLRDYNADDLDSIHAFISDSKVMQYVDIFSENIEESKQHLDEVITSQHKNPRGYFDLAVVLKENQTLIGTCGLGVRDVANKQGEVFYYFNRYHWGIGYATEAAKTLIAFGFNELGLHRIYATHFVGNESSAKVLQKLGMQKEGCLREPYWVKSKQKWTDAFLYSILNREFKENK